MTVCHLVRRAGFGMAVLGLALLGQTRALAQTAPPPAPTTHTITLKNARVSRVDDTHIVITAEAAGDIRGSVTFHLEGGAQGWSGNWALVSSYVQDFAADGTPAPEGPHVEGGPGEPHLESTVFVHDGGLSGTVDAGTLALTAEGALTGLSSPVTLTSGTMKFKGVTGAGDLSLSQLQDSAASTGTLTLTF
jgi:hypothetical protein